jgi:YidC/Oxa1 family membrane protein insertase
MEKRTIFAIAISFIILLLYQEIFMKKFFPTVSKNIEHSMTTDNQSKNKSITNNSEKEKKIAEEVVEHKTKPVKKAEEAIIKNPNEKFFNVENKLFKLTFSNKGAAVTKCVLKKYYQTVKKEKNVVLFDKKNDYPIESQFILNNISIPKDAIYKPMINRYNIDVFDKPVKIVFNYTNDRVSIDKIYTIFPDKYEVELDYNIRNLTNSPFDVQISTYFFRKEKLKKARYQFEGSCFLVDGVLKEVSVKKIEKEKTKQFTKKVQWLGYSEVYFISVILKRDSFFNVAKTYLYNGDVVLEGVKKINLKVNDTVTDSNSLYFGPKKYDILKSYHAGLERSINYGIFDFLAKPLMVLLNFFYKFVHNYGIAIIILTILIKLIFYPLTQKSYESMKRMKDLQPHITRLKEQYKDNKAKLNQEIMELYKKYKVNPFGGCLPVIIQIPVFFALYKALLNSIELRHACFIKYIPFTDKLWLVDLSVKDPYYITPILMGLSMFVQQKMTPTGGDAFQEKLMYIMPVFLTFLFLNFPSGLVVYWLVNNILSIFQQYMVNKKMK